MMFAGQIAGHGVSGSGTLSIQATNIRVDGLDATAPLELPVDTRVLDAGFVNKGFGHYSIIGVKGLTVEEGTQSEVTRTVWIGRAAGRGRVGRDVLRRGGARAEKK